MEALVSQTLKNEADTLLKRARSKSSGRIIQNADLSSTFGIEMEGGKNPPLGQKHKKSKPKLVISPATSKKSSVPKDAKPLLPGIKSRKKPMNNNPDYDLVVAMIRRRRVKGIGFKEIKERTGIEDTKIRNILFRAKQKNEIKNISRGLYIKET